MLVQIGYELRPGVAASTFLAFTLEDTPGAVEKTIIDIGTKVQSLPAQGQMPQIFETIEKIEARPECNNLKPRLTKTQTITNNTTKFFFKGINTRLKPGDGLLVVKYQSDNVVKYTSFNIISNIETDTILQQTHVDVLKQNLQSDEFDAYKIDVFTFRIQTGLFGHNAPNWHTLPKSLKEDCFKDTWEGSEGEGISINVDSQGKLYGNGNLIYLDNSYLGILPNSWIVLQNIHGYHASYLISSTHERTTVDFLLSTKVTGLILDLENKFSFNWDNVSTSKTESDRLKDFLKKNFHDDDNDNENSDNDLNWITDSQLEKIDNNKTIRIANGTNSLSIQLDDDITKATKATVKIKIGGKEKDFYEFIVRKESSSNNNINNIFENDLSKFKRRVTTAYVQSELLQLAEVPIEEPVEGNNVTLALDLDHTLPSLSVGQLISITGELVYTPQMTKRLTKNEVAIISSIQPDPNNSKYIKLIFTQDLDQKYKLDTVMLNANIARAIHGETKQEVLGSGDPSNREQQQFILKQKPLTFMSAPTASGTQSSLEIRVDNVLWKEVNNLYNLKPDDRAYIIRIDDNNQTRVIFGDNVKGASPSAGLENIEAKYKVGLGLSGMLKEDQLSVLASRPLGVRSVTNPIAPTGAADPEDRDHARQNAPLTVLTMERIVSLEDFENFAQAFAGIEKAQAAWLWNGKERIVHVTVASARGLPVNPTSILYNNLIKAINAAKDPVISFKVDSFRQKLFNIEAKILVAR